MLTIFSVVVFMLLINSVENRSSENALSNEQMAEKIVSLERELHQQRETIEAQNKILEQQREMLDKLLRGLRAQEDTTKFLLKFTGAEKKLDKDEPVPTDQREEGPQKRADDVGTLQPVVDHMAQQLTELTADVQVLKNANVLNELARGSAYIRWGSAGCRNSSEVVYSGFVGGSWYNSPGAGNHLCLSDNPTFDNHPVPRYGSSNLYGAEYETCDEPSCNLEVTCAVCRIPRATAVMVPGRNTCWSGWTLEYSGHLMTSQPTQHGASEYLCVDVGMGGIHGTQHDDNGRVLYYTVAQCGSLPCPPYVQGKIVSCAVCSK